MDKKIGIKDVAKAVGVSPSTVSRVLNESEHVSEVTRRKVLSAVKKLGYRPNQIARGLRLRKFRSIGLIIPDITNEFFARVAQSIEEELSIADYNLFLCNTDEDQEKERRYIKALLDKFVDGIIFVSAGYDENMDLFRGDVPVVAVDRKPDLDGVSFITSDNFEGGYLATKHLIEHGCERILMIRDSKEVSPMNSRQDGYLQCLADYNVMIDENLILRTPMDRHAVQERLLRMRNTVSFDGVFAGNDVLAIGAMKTLLKLGYKVPEEIQVVGFDDISESEFYNPSITTIRQDAEEIGIRSVDILLGLIEDPSTEPVADVLPINIVKRSSTR